MKVTAAPLSVRHSVRRFRRWIEWEVANQSPDSLKSRSVRRVLGSRLLPVPFEGFPREGRFAASSTTQTFSVDGYPRSGNSFAAASVRLAYPKAVIYSHSHSVVARSLAGHSGGLCIVPVRDPLDAVASLVVFTQSGKALGMRPISTRSEIRDEFERYAFLLSSPDSLKSRTVYVAFESIRTLEWLDDLSAMWGVPISAQVNGSDVASLVRNTEASVIVREDLDRQSSLPSDSRRRQVDQVREIIRSELSLEVARSRRMVEALWLDSAYVKIGSRPGQGG
jgi:hypothetical protein